MSAELHLAARQARAAALLLLLGVAAQALPVAAALGDAGVTPRAGDLLHVTWPQAVAFAMPLAVTLHAVAWRATGQRLAWAVSGRSGVRAGTVVALVWVPPLLTLPCALHTWEPAGRAALADRAVATLASEPWRALDVIDAPELVVHRRSDGAVRALVGRESTLAVRAAAVAGDAGLLTLAEGGVWRCGPGGDQGEVLRFADATLRLPLDGGRALADHSVRELTTTALDRLGFRWRRAAWLRRPADGAARLAGERCRRNTAWLAAWLALVWAGLAWRGVAPLGTARALLVHAGPALGLALFVPRLCEAVG